MKRLIQTQSLKQSLEKRYILYTCRSGDHARLAEGNLYLEMLVVKAQMTNSVVLVANDKITSAATP